MKKIFAITLILLISIICYFYYVSNKPLETNNAIPRVLITNFHPHTSGGQLTYILSIVKSSLNNEFELAVAAPLTSDVYKECTQLGIKTYPCDFPGRITDFFKILKDSKNLRAILREFKPDVVHTNGGQDAKLVVWNSLIMGQKPSVIRTYHVTKIISKDPYRWLLTNKLLDANLFISSSAFKLNAEGNGLHLENVHIIENSIDLEKFHPLSKNSELKEKLGIPNDYFVFGSNAGIGGYKRTDLMLEALTLFPPDAPFRVIALGRNPEPWIEKAKSMGVDKFIIFPGYHEDVRPFCSLFDTGFVLSTQVETSSFASREMLATGIPLISTYYSGLKDNVDDHVNGVFVKPNNVQEIYDAMNFFLSMPPSELETFRKNARLKAEKSFDLKNQIQALSNLYTDLINKRKLKEVSAAPVLAHQT